MALDGDEQIFLASEGFFEMFKIALLRKQIRA